MSFKITILLIILAVIAGVVYFVNPFAKEEDKAPASPWFYQVSTDDMRGISVTHFGETESFVEVPSGAWVFESNGITPDHNRWAGVSFLLGGPQTRRDLSETRILIEDPAEYGLDNPHTIVRITLTFDRTLEFRLGDTTTDGRHHYGQIAGFPQLFLIVSAWGDVLSRLIEEPPIPRWYVQRDIDSIVELNVYPASDNPSEDDSLLEFEKSDEGIWKVRDHLVEEEGRDVDLSRWNDVLPLLSRPEGVSVHVHRVDDNDYTEWGISEKSAGIEIRFEGITERGTLFTDGMLISIGDKSPDGMGYYAKSNEDGYHHPVLLIPSKWVETLQGLYDNVPYAIQ